MLSSGRFLKNSTKTLRELNIRHDQTINVTKKTTNEIEMETVEISERKISQVREICGNEFTDAFISFVLS
jgi:hypothetical protein